MSPWRVSSTSVVRASCRAWLSSASSSCRARPWRRARRCTSSFDTSARCRELGRVALHSAEHLGFAGPASRQQDPGPGCYGRNDALPVMKGLGSGQRRQEAHRSTRVDGIVEQRVELRQQGLGFGRAEGGNEGSHGEQENYFASKRLGRGTCWCFQLRFFA